MRRSLSGGSVEDGGLLGASPVSRAWCALPLLCGLPLMVLSVSQSFQLCVLGTTLRLGLALCICAAGVVSVGQAVPTYFIGVTAESGELEAILAHVRDRHRAAFQKCMDGLVLRACLRALPWAAATGYGALVYFDEAAAGAFFFAVSAGDAVSSQLHSQFMNDVVRLCQEEITVFIAEQLGGEVDWHRMAREHRALDARFENLFSEQRLGMLLLPLLLREVVLVCVLSILGNCVDDRTSAGMAWALAALMVLRLVWLLRDVAVLTDRCTHTSPQQAGWAIKASVNRASCSLALTEGQDVAHVRFVEYLANTTLGIQVFGINVNLNAIVSLLSMLMTAIPMVISFSRPLLDEQFAANLKAARDASAVNATTGSQLLGASL